MKKKHIFIVMVIILVCLCMCGLVACDNTHTHKFSTEWSFNETHHWHNCIDCDTKSDYAEHDFSNGKCICGAVEGLKYKLSRDGKGYILSSTDNVIDSNIVIKDTYNGKPVIAIGELAFHECVNIQSIIIPNGVTSIGKSAFEGCRRLSSITIPNSVINIGESAFYNCRALTEMSIPFVGETKDGKENTHLGYIFGAISYKDNSEYVPTSLKKIIITDGTRIGNYAFFDCKSLTSITIPESVTSIGYNLFSDSFGSTKVDIYYNGDKAAWCSIEGLGSLLKNTNGTVYIAGEELAGDLIIPTNITSIDSWAFEGCSGLTSVTIPDSVTSIGDNAFANCSGLTNVIIGDNVTSISTCAFYGCSSLTSVIIGKSVTRIGTWAFEHCNSLTEVTIPDSVNSIANWAFEDCSNLTSVTIGNGVTSIGEKAFYDCNNLTDIYYTGDIGSWLSISGLKYLMSDNRTLYIDGKELSGDLVIPDNVTSIGEQAFANCKYITSITIPNSVTSIGFSAFRDCRSLKSVTISDNVNTIGNNAFNGCPVENATIPTLAISCIPKSKLKTVIITSGRNIGYAAFKNCKYITSITISNSVTSIDNEAFVNCSSLTGIYYNGNIAGWCGITGLDNLVSAGCAIYVSGEKLSDLTSINIPNGVTSIGKCVFYNCKKLTSVTIPNSVTSIGVNAFSGCSALTNVIIGNSVTSIGKEAFYYCSSLTSVTIPDSVTSIGDSAFSHCRALTSVTIGNGVTNVGKEAFYGCSILTSIIIGNSVTNIGEKAFYVCYDLDKVYYKGTLAEWSKININYNSYYPNLDNATRYYYSELEPTDTDNKYWHYAEDGVTIVEW